MPVSEAFYLLFVQDTASLGSQKGGITKQGWLYKGNMNSAISVTMRVRECLRFYPFVASVSLVYIILRYFLYFLFVSCLYICPSVCSLSREDTFT